MKTDNDNLSSKLALRRYMLRKYHATGPTFVLDCCQATGKLWRMLQATHRVDRYWGVDQKKRKGRLKMNSVDILAQPLIEENVIDIDTYGSPWKHWFAMLPNLSQATTVFLTIGAAGMGTDHLLLQAMGLGPLVKKVPPGIARQIQSIGISYAIFQAHKCNMRVLEVAEAEAGSRARYLGVRLEPKGMECADGRVDHSLDGPYVQSVDGVRQGERRLQELLCGDVDQEQDGAGPVGAEQGPAGDEQGELAKADPVERRGEKRRRSKAGVLREPV